MPLGKNYWGWTMSLHEEFEMYEGHFLDWRGVDDHAREMARQAFFMGCLRMMQIADGASREELRGIAEELDNFLAQNDDCICESCKQARAEGRHYSLVNHLFGDAA